MTTVLDSWAWFAFMAAVAVGVTMLAAALYAVIAGAWLDTTNSVTGNRFSDLYELQGLVPIGASVFAVAIGIACGVLLRRTLPAMAATLGIFVVVRVATATLLRPRLGATETLGVPASPNTPTALRGAWVTSETTYDATGQQIGSDGAVNAANLVRQCPDDGGAMDPASRLDAVDSCLQDLGVHTVFQYHPADRFWTFQLIETGLLFGLAGTAIAVAATSLQRRAA